MKRKGRLICKRADQISPQFEGVDELPFRRDHRV